MSNNKPIVQPNGSLYYSRGVPPKKVPYHYRDDENPKLFHPDFIECKHRSCHPYFKKCGARAVKFMCSEKNREVSVPFCDDCEVEPKTDD